MAQAKKTTKPKTEAKETNEKQIEEVEVAAEAAPVENVSEVKIETESATAKAGKRSAKAVKEIEEKETKEARKSETIEPKKSKVVPKPRSKAERAGKKYKDAYKLIDRAKVYPLTEAIDLATKTATTKFDSSVELHINLGVDPKLADQNVRDSLSLPAGTGKTIRVATIPDEASAEKLFAKLDKEEIDFDVLIATPDMMPKLGKYARLLGPRGLMPNPKSGTVTQNVEAAAIEAKAGRVEYRVDQHGIVHLGIGKVSFGPEKLRLNAEAVLASVRAAKPASLKAIYIKSIYVTTTMGPSIKVDTSA